MPRATPTSHITYANSRCTLCVNATSTPIEHFRYNYYTMYIMLLPQNSALCIESYSLQHLIAVASIPSNILKVSKHAVNKLEVCIGIQNSNFELFLVFLIDWRISFFQANLRWCRAFLSLVFIAAFNLLFKKQVYKL